MNTHSKRRIASMMLVFWLFAVGAAWANACVLQDRGTHWHAADAIAAGTPPAVSAGHVGVVDDHGVRAAPGAAPCLKACDDRSQSLVKAGASIDFPALTTLTSAWVTWLEPVAALDAAQAAHIDLPAPAGPPLRTRYSRLAL